MEGVLAPASRVSCGEEMGQYRKYNGNKLFTFNNQGVSAVPVTSLITEEKSRVLKEALIVIEEEDIAVAESTEHSPGPELRTAISFNFNRVKEKLPI